MSTTEGQEAEFASKAILLPDSSKLDAVFLAEGAANVIFRLRGRGHLDAEVKKLLPYLLRLRKTLKSSSPNLEAYTILQTRFVPILSEGGTVETLLVRLPCDLVKTQNEYLRQLEASGTRPKKRHGLYLAEDEEYGFLLEDMSPTHQDEVLVEFKPKWLVQSQSAPKAWKRCRSCALRLYKADVSVAEGPQKINEDHWFCPFDLVSSDKGRVSKAADGILSLKGSIIRSHNSTAFDPAARQRLHDLMVDVLYQNPIIQRIASLQRELDERGLIDTLDGYRDGSDRDGQSSVGKLATCMTLRDLTMFLKVNVSPGVPKDSAVRVRIGDLDVKSPDNGKAAYWIKIEKLLTDGGWYDATEQNSHPNVFRSTGRFLCKP